MQNSFFSIPYWAVYMMNNNIIMAHNYVYFSTSNFKLFHPVNIIKVFYYILFRKLKAEKEDLISTRNQLSSDLERLLNQREVQCQGLDHFNIIIILHWYCIQENWKLYDLWYGIIVMAIRINSTPELWEISLINNTEKVVWMWTMEAQGNLY